MRLNQVTVGATDVPASIAFYMSLGFELIVRSEHYARFIVPEGGGTFSLHAVPSVPRDGAPVVYFECDDLDARVARLCDVGIVFDLAPTDQAWLWREAHLRDPAGNALILFSAGVNRLDPPWRIRSEA
jgi:catechol 2,3-dioxygenase-like lactoylglutathione lyase family enzyme